MTFILFYYTFFCSNNDDDDDNKTMQAGWSDLKKNMNILRGEREKLEKGRKHGKRSIYKSKKNIRKIKMVKSIFTSPTVSFLHTTGFTSLFTRFKFNTSYWWFL